MRHALGILGVLAAGVLLAVSAAMNWRFGVSLGRTEFDGMIYGSASAAADCLKALIPFFLFAAIRSRMWSQAIASAVVGTVVVAYSLTSALGHAALNRLDVSGQREAAASTYKDLRADLARAHEQAGWIPQHRPMLSVQADIDAAKTQAAWRYTKRCSKATGPKGRAFCQSYHALQAELAAADQAAALEAKIAGLNAKLGKAKGQSVMSEADPQAAVLAKLAGSLTAWNLKVDDVQTALTVFIALLLEIGSGLGMYIAFSQWRLYDQKVPVVRRRRTDVAVQGDVPEVLQTSSTQSVEGEALVPIAAPQALPEPEIDDKVDEPEPLAPAAQVSQQQDAQPQTSTQPKSKPKRQVAVTAKDAAKPLQAAKPKPGDNDNRTKPAVAQRLLAPETDVERCSREAIEVEDQSTVLALDLYNHYCDWCETLNKEPLAMPTFLSQFAELGVKKSRAKGRTWYHGIALKPLTSATEDKKQPAFVRRAA